MASPTSVQAVVSAMASMASRASSALGPSRTAPHIDLVLNIHPPRSFTLTTDTVTDDPQVSLESATVEQIVGHILSARTCGTESIISFHWQPSGVDGLFKELGSWLKELSEFDIRRFEYDYESETVYLDITEETELQYKVQASIRGSIQKCLNDMVADMDDSAIRQLIEGIKEGGASLMKYEGKIYKQADVSFGRLDCLPSLVCEIC